ncbi:hypothetical protein, partial [Escherichia coli]|uniref:hypothetical protein n=1 Tax=Escherichia coli TaxID=562 RepID=UPI001BC89B15
MKAAKPSEMTSVKTAQSSAAGVAGTSKKQVKFDMTSVKTAQSSAAGVAGTDHQTKAAKPSEMTSVKTAQSSAAGV